MTDQEYELEYRHALQELSTQGYEVVEPRKAQDHRLVLIDGFPCSDWEVFNKAYGEQTAEMITGERPKQTASHPGAS